MICLIECFFIAIVVVHDLLEVNSVVQKSLASDGIVDMAAVWSKKFIKTVGVILICVKLVKHSPTLFSF